MSLRPHGISKYFASFPRGVVFYCKSFVFNRNNYEIYRTTIAWYISKFGRSIAKDHTVLQIYRYIILRNHAIRLQCNTISLLNRAIFLQYNAILQYICDTTQYNCNVMQHYYNVIQSCCNKTAFSGNSIGYNVIPLGLTHSQVVLWRNSISL